MARSAATLTWGSRIIRTASFRLAALYVLVFAVSVLVLGGVMFWITRNALEQQMHARIATEATLLQGEFQSGGVPALTDAIRRREQGPGALDYLLQAANGTRVAGEMPALGNRTGWIMLAVSEKPDGGHRPEQVQALAARLPDGGLLAVGDDLARLKEAQEAIVTALIWVIGLTVLLGIGGGVLLSRAFLHRVDSIGRTAEAIIAGDLTRRIPLHGTGDDLDRLAETLNHMLDRIGALMDSLRQVSSDIAHDLRTPLSRLLQRLERARDQGGGAADRTRAMDAAAAESRAMLETFEALLRIAEVEAGSGRSGFQTIDLSELTETVIDAFAPSAEEQGHALTGKLAAGIAVQGDRELLTQLLVNLVENALRHTPPGTPVAVMLARATDGRVCLTVEDHGPGVPAAERGRILQRFYRCEQSRTTSGNGLGLSLVAAVAALHGAELRVEDAGPGLRVTLRFKPHRQ